MAKKKKVGEEEQFHVEVITKARVNKSKWEYYVKWAGYDSEDNSWEPESNVETCDRLLKSFWRNFPPDDEDYPSGTILEAKPEWIEQEKKYFAKNFEGTLKQEKEEEEEPKQPKKSRGRKAVKREASTSSLRVGSSKKIKKEIPPSSPQSSEDESISSHPHRKRLRKPSPEYASDSSDDKPLKKIPRIHSSKSGSTVSSSSKGKERAQPTPPPTGGKATPPVQIQKVRLPATAPKSAPPVQKVDIFKGNEHAQPAPPAKKPPAPQASNERASSPSSLFSAPSTPNISANKTLPSAPEPIRPKPAEPPTKPLPSHRAPGRIKLMDFSEQNTSSGSIIPTKLRIARGASGSGPKPAQAAKAVNQTTNKPSLEDIIPKKPSLSLLNFKRKPKGAEDGKSPTSPQVASATSSTGGFDFGQRSAGQSSKFSDVGSLVRSPASMHDDLPGDQLNDINYLFEEPPPPSAAPVERPKDPRRQLPRRTSMQKQDLMVEADLLLSTMMPPALAAPMHEPTGQEELTSPVAGPSGFTASRIVQQQSMSRIPKKWKWTGELYMDTGHDMATKLCSITLSDPTEPKPQGLRLNICLSTADSIRFKKLHDAPDLPTMLQASEPVQQFCRVTHKEAEDLNALKTLQTYMTKKRMFTYAHVYLDHNPVALLVVFPSTHTDICNLLKVPLYLAHDGALIAALIPWTLASEQYQKNRWTKSRSLISATEHGLDPGFTELFKTTGKQLILTHPSLQRGLRIHKFPKKLFDSLTKKPYCVWFSPTDGPMNSPGFETASLKAVLKACGAFDVGYKKDVKAIFVHVGALNTMHKVPSIANRRAKIPDLRFFTYGTHETVPPERWGVREVYPIGGCVTFTPSAFLEDPIGVYQLIKKFDEHPFWAVFLPPNVVGVIAKMVCNGIDPVSVFDSDSFVFTPLLKSIKEGEVSLLTAPPLQRYPKESLSVERRWDDPAMTWIVAQFHQMSMTPRDLLDSCMRSLQEKHANADDKTLVATIGREALEEMRQMQFQPVLMDSYRRFVVIKARKETDLNDRNDTLECTSLGDFKFRDEAFDLPKK